MAAKKAKVKTGAAKQKRSSISHRNNNAKSELKTKSPAIGRKLGRVLVHRIADDSEEPTLAKKRSQTKPQKSDRGVANDKWRVLGCENDRNNFAAFVKRLWDQRAKPVDMDAETDDALNKLFSSENICKAIECFKSNPDKSWSEKPVSGLKFIADYKKWAEGWGFDLKQYRVCPHSTVADWALHVSIRRGLMFLFAIDETRSFADYLLRCLIKDPSFLSKPALENVRHTLRIPDSENNLACPTFAVRPLDSQTAYEYAKQIVNFREEVMAGKYGHEIQEAFMKNGTSIDVLLWKTGQENPLGHLLVDIRGAVTKPMLIQEFQQCLDWLGTQLDPIFGFEATDVFPNEIDEKFGGRNRISPRTTPLTLEDFNRWHDNKVLPYIDLRLAAYFDQCKLRVDDMGKLLFPYSKDKEERAADMKPTKVYADELGSNAAFSKLFAEMQSEIAKFSTSS